MGSNGGDIGYYRARYVDTGAGRFLQADPMGMIDGPNRYAYVQNVPTMATDPSGWSLTHDFFGLFTIEYQDGCGLASFERNLAYQAAWDAMGNIIDLHNNPNRGFVFEERNGRAHVFRYTDVPMHYGVYFKFTRWPGEEIGAVTTLDRERGGKISVFINPAIHGSASYGLTPAKRLEGTMTHEWFHHNTQTASYALTEFYATAFPVDGVKTGDKVGVPTRTVAAQPHETYTSWNGQKMFYDTLGEHAGYITERIFGIRDPRYYMPFTGFLH